MRQYWTEEDGKKVEVATTFEELRDVALKIVSRIPAPVGQVCGPISTGGAGSVKENLRLFQLTIDTLISDGLFIFDQLPFEEHIHRIIHTPYYKGGNQLLEAFYLPIFKSGIVRTLYFMADWRTSLGATWEHEQAKRLKIKIYYL